ncbi:hypothetical protein SAMN05216312_11713 [Cohnella sp. OV330]|uniref:hypothetical protein n=1 Tax=Cohnella sp. OV330 TaxID=1855288 RepID=UPI0008E604D0|nr:hypothetical protein [Cohnella sp. OV330]SFB60591.1 hypothetical protein SAMN05216312_11713 [Cohnella sp. OV330]
MAERAVLAYFNTPDQARQALEGLKSLRLSEHGIDRFDGYPGAGMEHLDQLGNTIAGTFRGLGFITLGGDFDNPDAAVLAAASVSASGMSSGGPDNRVTGRDILLTAIVDEDDYDQAVEICRQAGAL